jgi:hypothetical protein
MLRLAAVLFAGFPAAAWASDHAAIRMQEAPIGATRTTAAAAAPGRFDLVGLHWQGSGTVLFRTRDLAGRWSRWQPAAPEDDRPNRGSPETQLRSAWRLGSPYWVGASTMLAYRLVGRVRRLRIWYVWSPATRTPLRSMSMAGSPRIVPRAGWHAEDEILRGPPRYAKSVAFAVVHHTAGTNVYTRAQSAAIVLGIELYHVRGNGWNDIGYNFLVDKYGQVFEGRAGGIDRSVIGAHAEGFNTGSVGVALIGNYSSTNITQAARQSLVDLLAWRLDVAHVDPLSTLTWRSGGNPEYPRGKAVQLRAISGHRDTGYTSCPGSFLYARLPDIAKAVAATGLPKLYSPLATGGLGGIVRFTARLSAAGPWTVTVRDSSGNVVARGRGTGQTVAWAWDATGIPPSRSYAWTIEGGTQTRPATGTIGKAPPPPPPASILSGLTATPPVISPDGDGIADGLAISYTLAARASVTAAVKDSLGSVVATVFSNQLQSPRTQSFSYAASGLADGKYTFSVVAVGADGRSSRLEVPFGIDRTLSGLMLTAAILTPNGDGVDDTIGIAFTLGVGANVTIQIEQNGLVVATVFSGVLPAGTSQFAWDGTAAAGTATSGTYDAAVIVDGPYGQTRHQAPFTVSD